MLEQLHAARFVRECQALGGARPIGDLLFVALAECLGEDIQPSREVVERQVTVGLVIESDGGQVELAARGNRGIDQGKPSIDPCFGHPCIDRGTRSGKGLG